MAERQNGFPKLPIVTPDPPAPPARTQTQKYGGLFHFGIAGLVVLVGLVAWFAYGVWQLRDAAVNFYVLNDSSRPETARIEAAYRLSRDPRLNDTQFMQGCLDLKLPDLARYLLAEAVSVDAVANDPRGYALMVGAVPAGRTGCDCSCPGGSPTARGEASRSPPRPWLNSCSSPTP